MLCTSFFIFTKIINIILYCIMGSSGIWSPKHLCVRISLQTSIFLLVSPLENNLYFSQKRSALYIIDLVLCSLLVVMATERIIWNKTDPKPFETVSESDSSTKGFKSTRTAKPLKRREKSCRTVKQPKKPP